MAVRPPGSLTIPVVDAALINHLEQIFRFSLSPSHDLRKYDRMCGSNEVLEYLRAAHRDQNP
jgi:hypothetical protein